MTTLRKLRRDAGFLIAGILAVSFLGANDGTTFIAIGLGVIAAAVDKNEGSI